MVHIPPMKISHQGHSRTTQNQAGICDTPVANVMIMFLLRHYNFGQIS
jgi:hypothetical protein